MLDDCTSGVFQVLPTAPLVKPNERLPETGPALDVPAGTIVFSADNHIELGEDIWYQNFPAHLKEQAPRIWQTHDGATHLGPGGKSILPDAYADVFKPFGLVAGFVSTHMDARMKHMDDEGIDKELAFPNAILALLSYPDLDVRERCFRIYNEYLATLQNRYPGRFYGVGLINWWDAEGTRTTLQELKTLGLKTFLLPLNPGMDTDGERVDYTSKKMFGVWDAIEEADLPVSHHIGEVFSNPAEFNHMTISFVHGLAPFREQFAKLIFGGILDRHPSLQVGWFESGINWVPSAIQDAVLSHANFWHMENLKIKHDPEYYWHQHMYTSFMVDPLGLEMIDKVGADRVMWSHDYPHNESALGYARTAINHIAKTVGPERAQAVLGGNVARYLKV